MPESTFFFTKIPIIMKSAFLQSLMAHRLTAHPYFCSMRNFSHLLYCVYFLAVLDLGHFLMLFWVSYFVFVSLLPTSSIRLLFKNVRKLIQIKTAVFSHVLLWFYNNDIKLKHNNSNIYFLQGNKYNSCFFLRTVCMFLLFFFLC